MVAHEKTHEYGFIFNKESYSLGNDTWSEMGKHCHVTKEVYSPLSLPIFSSIMFTAILGNQGVKYFVARSSLGWCPLVERSLGLDKITKTKKAWIMVSNVYCSTCELCSLFYLNIYCFESSNLRLRSVLFWNGVC